MDAPRLFLVRVWQHLRQFRAAVRGMDESEPRLFDEPAQLGEFLRQASAEAPPAPARAGHASTNAGQTPPGDHRSPGPPNNPREESRHD